MKKNKITALLTALIFGFASFAVAEEDAGKGKGKGKGKGMPNPAELFSKLDTDGSGAISLEEMKASPMGEKAKDPSKLEERFAKMDADSNGEVSKEEHMKAFKEM
ncbi:MAG: EF-hand domain-containing protein, partial [Verrucomicrobiota bacterium]